MYLGHNTSQELLFRIIAKRPPRGGIDAPKEQGIIGFVMDPRVGIRKIAIHDME